MVSFSQFSLASNHCIGHPFLRLCNSVQKWIRFEQLLILQFFSLYPCLHPSKCRWSVFACGLASNLLTSFNIFSKFLFPHLNFWNQYRTILEYSSKADLIFLRRNNIPNSFELLEKWLNWSKKERGC